MVKKEEKKRKSLKKGNLSVQKKIYPNLIQKADNLATFYPEVQKFILNKVGKEVLEKNLKESYSYLKSSKAKNMANKYLDFKLSFLSAKNKK